MPRTWTYFVLIGFTLVFPGLAMAQDSAPPSEAPRLTGGTLPAAPTIDGTVSPGEWDGAAEFGGVLFDDDDGRPSTQVRATYRLAYDPQYLYFSAVITDPNPDGIRAEEYRTNVDLGSDDRVSLMLDLTGSLSNFNRFSANARGATSIDLAGGRAAKREWMGDFVARSRRTSTGWETEWRIPWQILPLGERRAQDVRFNVDLDIQRRSEDWTFVYTEAGRQRLTPYWMDVNLPEKILDRRIRLLPYTYLGYDPDRDEPIINSGIDLKTQLTEEITAVATVLPDFRNIEEEILGLDFDRFVRITGESRPFFLEGGDYLRSAIFTSRRIPRIDWGLNAYGKLSDRTTFGMITTQDFGDQFAFATSLRKQVTDTQSYGVAFSSLEEPGRSNTAALMRVNTSRGPANFGYRMVLSQDTFEGFGQDHEVDFSYNKGRTNVWSELSYRSADYDPGLAFVRERDYMGGNLGASVGFRPRGGRIFETGFTVYSDKFWRTSGENYRDNLGGNAYMLLRNRWSFSVGADASTFEDSKDVTYSGSIAFPFDDGSRQQSVEVVTGRIEGENYNLLSINSNWRPLSTLRISASYQRFELFESAEQLIVTGSYDLTRDLTVSGRAVRRDAKTNWYVSLRQSGIRGAEYFLIVGDPNAREFRESVIVKVTVPFDLMLGRSRREVSTVVRRDLFDE